MDGGAVVAVGAALSVAGVAVHGAARAVYRNLVVVHAQAVALRVGVVKQARLQHAVGRNADAGHEIAWREGGLFDIGKEIFRVFVQFKLAYFNQRIVFFRPDFGQVKRVVRHFFGIRFGHDLHVHRPFREVATLDGFIKVALVAFAVVGDDGGGLGVGQVFNALLGAEMEFHPETLVLRVDKAVSVRTEAVHMAVAGGDAAVAHHDGDLVEGFRQERPEIPVVGGRTHIGARVAFYRFVQIGEFARVAQEEDRRVIADHVPVAFFGVKLQRKAADVALGIGRAALTGNGSKAGEHFGFFADFAEEFGAGVFCDVVGDGKRTKRARAFGVHTAFGDDFAHEVGEFFVQPQILRQERAARPGGHGVLVIDNGRAVVHGQVGYRAFVHHGFLLLLGGLLDLAEGVFVAGFTFFIQLLDRHLFSFRLGLCSVAAVRGGIYV